MNLGIDITFLDTLDEKQGVNRYAMGIINELKNTNKYKIQIYTNQKIYKDAKKKFLSKKINVYQLNSSYEVIKKIFYFFLVFLGFFNIYFFKLHYLFINLINEKEKKFIEDKSDILIFLNAQDISYNFDIKTIINFHDLLHKRFPNFFSKKELILREYVYRNSSFNSDVLIASSFFMKREFLKFYYFLKNKRIIIMREGINKKIFNLKNVIKKKNRKREFIFYPAQLWYHKNHLTLLKAFKIISLKQKKLQLILCGSKKNNFLNILNYIKLNSLQNRVKYLGNISQKKLEHYYKNCLLVVLPSLYESSSLVALEAIKMKKPVVCSNISPMLELKNKFKLIYFNSNSSNSLVKSLVFAIKNKKKLKKYCRYNYQNLNDFNWQKTTLVLQKEILKLSKN